MERDAASFLAEAEGREEPDLVRITIRDLIGKWGFKRRGSWLVWFIEKELDEAGLFTEPPFARGWIGQEVTLVPKRLLHAPDSTLDQEDTTVLAEEVTTNQEEVGLLVSTLRSANQGVTSVPLDGSLVEAQTLMMRFDFSQLGVMSGERQLRGAVTWESMAQAAMRSAGPALRDCVVAAEIVRDEDDLIHHIPRIIQAGYVFVRAKDDRITGIVTTADLSEEFGQRATPFFLIGEIERRLRRVVDRVFSADELSEVRAPIDPSRDVTSAEDLTIGEYVRLLEKPDRWAKMDWPVERAIFIDALDGVRKLRNDVFHFSPDPLDEDQLDELRRFVRWLKILDP